MNNAQEYELRTDVLSPRFILGIKQHTNKPIVKVAVTYFKLTYLHLFTDRFMTISLLSLEQISDICSDD